MAGLLAAAVAFVLIRAQFRMAPDLPNLSDAADTALILFNPVVALAADGGYEVGASMKDHGLYVASLRYSLALLHDAGFDISKAPIVLALRSRQER